MAASFLSPLLRGAGPSLALINLRTHEVLARRVLTAFDSQDRRRGLLGRDHLEEGHVMIVAPSNAVHTFFMRFPLDLVFVSRSGQIVKLCPNVPPWRIAGALRAFAVVEAPVGTIARSGTRAGDMLGFTPAL